MPFGRGLQRDRCRSQELGGHLLPITFKLPPVSAIIMLAGIFYGVMYGGSTTSILLYIPEEVASAVTCIDGYQMALHGRAGPASAIAATGVFIPLLTLGIPGKHGSVSRSRVTKMGNLECGMRNGQR
jgi:TctA family transporter